MREHNVALVIRSLWNEPDGLSRADLSRRLGLSRSTVSSIVQGLLASGLVVESHRARSTGGRRAIVLRFFDAHRHVLGIDLGASHVTVVRTDLRGRVLARQTRDMDVQRDPEGTLALLDTLVDEVVDAKGPPVLGIGVGVPCPVDAASGHHLSPRILPAWKGVLLGDWLYERFGTPVFMDNDANVGALAEAWWGAGRGADDFAFIKVGTGVGAGYLLARQPYRGSSGIAGEIGHTTVNAQGRMCRCGLRGCLEAEVGSPALVDKARAALSAGYPSTLNDAPTLDLPALLAHAEAGDGLSVRIVTEAGEHLGIAVANLLNLLNPNRVVIGGRLSTIGELLMEPMRRTVEARALSTSLERADILTGDLEEEQVAVGAATLVVQQALRNPNDFIHPRRVRGASSSIALS